MNSALGGPKRTQRSVAEPATGQSQSEFLTPHFLMYVVNAITEMDKTVPGIAAEYASGLAVLEESASSRVPPIAPDNQALLMRIRQKLERASSRNEGC